MDRFLRYLRKAARAPGSGEASDGELLERFVDQQDEAAFETLLQRHGPMVLQACQGMLRDPHAAEDAFQAVFLVLVRRAGSLHRHGSLGGWLHGVAHRVALKARGTAARRWQHERQAGAMTNEAWTDAAPDNQDLRPVLTEELNRLPEKYRTPLVLCYLEGKSNEEAARQLGCPVGTVWARLTRAREQLRGRLARRGLALTSAALGSVLTQQAASAALPAALLSSTLQAALLVSTGQTSGGAISAQAAALAESVLQAMWVTRMQIAAAVVLALSVVGAGAGVVTHWAFAAHSAPPMPPVVWNTPPNLEGKRPFPADNLWNQDVSKEPVDPNSAALLASIGLDKPLYPDFGAVHAGEARGLPYIVVGGDQPKVPIRFIKYPAESDPGPYPIPPDAPVEGGPVGTGSRRVIVVDRDTWKLYELLDAVREEGGWRADAGAVWDLNSNALRPRGRTSADGAGLPIFPGLVRYDEVMEQRRIEHALRFTVRRTRAAYVSPARHRASDLKDPNLPPMGMRVRLRSDFDLSSFPPPAQVILAALKKYGMFVASHGEDWALSGAPDPRWNDADLQTLQRVAGRDFEVVRMEKLLP